MNTQFPNSMVSGCLRMTLGPTCRSSPTALHSARITTRRIVASKLLSPVLKRANKLSSSSLEFELRRCSAKPYSHAGSWQNSRRPKVADTCQSPSSAVGPSSLSVIQERSRIRCRAAGIARLQHTAGPVLLVADIPETAILLRLLARVVQPGPAPLHSPTVQRLDAVAQAPGWGTWATKVSSSLRPQLPEKRRTCSRDSGRLSASGVGLDSECRFRCPLLRDASGVRRDPRPERRKGDKRPSTSMVHAEATSCPGECAAGLYSEPHFPGVVRSIQEDAAASPSGCQPGLHRACHYSLQDHGNTCVPDRDHAACGLCWPTRDHSS